MSHNPNLRTKNHRNFFYLSSGTTPSTPSIYSISFTEGSSCENSNSSGICTKLENCQVAVDAVKKYRYHDLTRCGFEHFTEIVCCPDPEVRHTHHNKTKKPKPTIKPRPSTSSRSGEACAEYTKTLPIILSYHIVGGENAGEKEFPHMTALGFYNSENKEYLFNCGGTLITNLYIVTAAHCIINVQKNELKIARLGVIEVPDSISKPDPSKDHNVINVTVHREYNWKEKFNDIALVKLEESVTFSETIRPACLYTRNNDPEKMIVTGWGAVSLGGDRSSILQKAVLTSRSLSECNSTYLARTKRIVLRSQICAADERSDACQGDSGGPLQVQGNGSVLTLVGITSYGIGCGSKYPGIYTRIYSYLDWIEGIVWV